MRIGVDLMGGDLAPDPIVEGALASLKTFGDDDRLVLFGPQDVLDGAMANIGDAGDLVECVASTGDEVTMEDSPVEAVRVKTGSALVQMAKMAGPKAGDQRIDMAISAGNTGCFVAAAQMFMRRLPGVARPGIAALVPTFAGPVTFIDVGANVDPKAHHLYQYGVMGSVYTRKVLGIEKPRVGLLNVGGEEQKGTETTKRVRDLLREDEHVEFIGFVEGRAIFDGACDVVVSDGVTGNVMIKLAEGLASGIFKRIQSKITGLDPEVAQKFGKVVKDIYADYDYHAYGGAPLLGVNGGVLICHGSSKAITIENAVAAARRFVDLGVNERIKELVEHHDEASVG